MSQYLFLLLLCFFMHACNARCLLLKVSTHEGAEVNKLQNIPMPKSEQIMEELTKTHEEDDEVKTLLKKFSKEQESTKEQATPSGNMIIVSPHINFGEGAKEEVMMKSGERVLLASGDTEEAVDSNENEKMGDVVMMDYAQPHRKPPIHNEKP